MRSIVCMTVAAVLLASGGASAGEKASTVSQTVTPDDEQAAVTFARDASLAGLFDVESAQLALDRATSPDVRKLAREILEDQSLANSRLLPSRPNTRGPR